MFLKYKIAAHAESFPAFDTNNENKGNLLTSFSSLQLFFPGGTLEMFRWHYNSIATALLLAVSWICDVGIWGVSCLCIVCVCVSVHLSLCFVACFQGFLLPH